MKTMSTMDILLTPPLLTSITPPKNLQSENAGLFAGLLEEEVDRLEVPPAQDLSAVVDELIASLSTLVQGITLEQAVNQGDRLLFQQLEEGLKQVQALHKEFELAQVRVDYTSKLDAIKNLQEEMMSQLHSLSLVGKEGKTNENQADQALPKVAQILGLILEKVDGLAKSIEKKDSRLLIPDRLGLHLWQAKALAIGYPIESTQHRSDVLPGENETSQLQRTDVSAVPMGPLNMGTSAEAKESRSVPIQLLAKEMESILTRTFVVKSSPQVQEMILQLKPESLGKLDVKLQSINGQLTAKFMVETAMAKQAVEDQLVQLRHNLQLQGVSVQHLEVVESSTQSSNSLLFQQQQKQYPHEQRGYMNRGKKNKEYMDPDDEAVNVQPMRSVLGQSGINYTV